ncbi:MAG: D-alanyl-D-alanine carboxypeptidase family protein [Alphaproteobacteria bacterium]
MSLSRLTAFHPRLSSRLAAAVLALLVGTGPVWAIETAAKQAILIDAETGAVLLEKNADEPTPPSSMSKVMTVYMVFERLKDGSLSLDDKFPVSKKAWQKKGSKMYVLIDTSVRVEDLLRGIIVQSGNDASIVIAEGLAGSEEDFAAQMNEKAREIGLEASVFRNASGWPEEGHVMSVRDIATLARRTIQDFPEYYPFYAEKSFTYSGIRQGNRNPLLYRNMGADGLKTGSTEGGGFGLAASAVRDGQRLILAINGLPSARARAIDAQRLIEWGFREFNNFALFRAGETVEKADVWLGTEPAVALVIEKDLVVTLPRTARRKAKITVLYTGPIAAPVKMGTEIAKLVITAPGIKTVEVPLLAGADVEQLGLFGRLSAAIGYLLWGG